MNESTSSPRHIHVRMYNVGFGDCFLLRIPSAQGERRVLIDCGYHSQGKGQFSDKQLVEQIKTDLGGAGLDVVVATHRHQDHISGFGETALWADVTAEEVWLPFTVNPKSQEDDPALRDWNALMRDVHGLLDASGKLTNAAVAGLAARDAVERAGLQEAAEFMLWNARSNEPGIDNLLRGFKRADGRQAKRRFLPDDKQTYPSSFQTPELPGVTVHVLGPPIDPALRRSRRVPTTWGFGTVTATVSTADCTPFPSGWRVDPKCLPDQLPFTPSTCDSIRGFNDDVLNAAKALDSFLNGESLVLVLEVGSARLLFAGDAEVGAWTQILGSPDAVGLAASATFLKVGHHGSHNATPITFIRDHVAKRTPAMISTQQGPGNYRNGIPFADLLDAMTDRDVTFVRSDRGLAGVHGSWTEDPEKRWIDVVIPT